MKAFAKPATVIPGATPIMASSFKQATDKKGRPLWDMPNPVAYVVHNQVVDDIIEVDGKLKKVRVRKPVDVPVYRGVDAAVYSKLKANARRSQRLIEDAGASAE